MSPDLSNNESAINRKSTTDHSIRHPSRLLLFLIVVLVLVTILALVLFIGLCTKGFGAWENKVCQSRQCVRAAARITSYMDETVDPCHDFYKYTCGGYEKSQVIPPGSATINPWSTLSSEIQIKLKSLLESPSSIDHLRPVQQAKNYYKSCMNETYLNELGLEPMKKYIEENGGWALLDTTWNGANFNLEEYIVKIGSDSMPRIISWQIGPNLKNSKQNIVYIGQSALSLGNRDYYLKSKAENPLLKAYEEMMVKFVVLLGGDEAQVRPKIVKMIDFETEMARLTVPAADRQATNRRLMVLQDVGDRYKGVNITKIVNGYLTQVNLKVKNTDSIGVADDPYLQQIGALVQRTSNETLAIYVMWGAIQALLDYTDKETRTLRKELQTLSQGSSVEGPRYQTCSGKTNHEFSYAVARLFVDQYFKEGTDDIKDMTNRLKRVFKDDLDRVDWLDESSREEARSKVDVMGDKLAYPEFILNNEALEQKSAGIEDLQPDQYLSNTAKLNRNAVKRHIRALNKPVDYIKWQMPPVTVNAFYNPAGNLMVFPLGILQPPFYDINGLKVLNYAGVGTVMGHEITHGFDNNGRLYDKNGNRREWWSPQSVTKFLDKAKCVEKQFSNISITGLDTYVNGKLTQGENIADIGAIKQSFQAYQTWTQENGQEQSLPGLDLPSSRLFFVAYAQMYCQLITPQLLNLLSKKDSHTPMRERVYGTLINSEHFSKTFKCPQGSRMNPGQRCSVW